MLTRRHAALSLGCASIAPSAARAEAAWPSDRPINFVVPFPPGGGTDIMARAMLSHLERALPGARFVILNRPGAGGELGYAATATAPPDGYTIGVTVTPSLETITIERTPRYRLDDFAFLGTVVEDPGAFFVAPASPFRTLADLAAHARSQPEQVTVGTAGIGSDDHLLMLGFGAVANVRMTHVPFSGQAPTVTALLGGQITVAAMNIGEGWELVRQGAVRPLGQAGARRWPVANEVPTFREQGFDLVSGVVRAIALPAATPQPIQQRLAAALTTVMRDPQWQAEADRLYQPLRYMDPVEFTRFERAEADRLRSLWQERPWKE